VVSNEQLALTTSLLIEYSVEGATAGPQLMAAGRGATPVVMSEAIISKECV
jgi:hypothetical protein